MVVAVHPAARLLLALVSLVVLLEPVSAQEAPISATDDDARKIVADADRIRFPQEGFQVDVTVTTSGTDSTSDERKYRILSKGNENTVVMVTEPASERGQIMLMKGRDLWVFLPSVSQPVRISLSQRLTGQIANGDLARANFAGDYAPKFIRADLIDGQVYNVLELVAVDRSVTYQRVLYWVRKSNSWPLRAEFYSASGRLLKSCTYEKFENMAGGVRPTRLVMEDSLRKTERSVLEYSAMKLRDLPDKVFTKDYLKRLD